LTVICLNAAFAFFKRRLKLTRMLLTQNHHAMILNCRFLQCFCFLSF
jgi:hypothetical protein